MVALRKKAARSGTKNTKNNFEEDASLSEETTDDLLWGTNTVLEALRRNARSLGELLVQKGKAGPKIQEIKGDDAVLLLLAGKSRRKNLCPSGFFFRKDYMVTCFFYLQPG
ncbi:MAG: hypothetical protein D3925_09360, partial [Candidatus Electrothrix sp. AR5]|nr:hypothetical protein [Candidatus Electrothrix sp. AR5]